MPLLGSAVETSDQRVSLRRSSNGKSNSVARKSRLVHIGAVKTLKNDISALIAISWNGPEASS